MEGNRERKVVRRKGREKGKNEKKGERRKGGEK